MVELWLRGGSLLGASTIHADLHVVLMLLLLLQLQQLLLVRVRFAQQLWLLLLLLPDVRLRLQAVGEPHVRRQGGVRRPDVVGDELRLLRLRLLWIGGRVAWLQLDAAAVGWQLDARRRRRRLQLLLLNDIVELIGGARSDGGLFDRLLLELARQQVFERVIGLRDGVVLLVGGGGAARRIDR